MRFTIGPIDVRILQAPRLFIRVWRLTLMWWPNEPKLSDRIEVRWR